MVLILEKELENNLSEIGNDRPEVDPDPELYQYSFLGLRSLSKGYHFSQMCFS